MGQRLRVAFVTNFCPYYRVRTFEALAHLADVDYFFFSDGREWYWEKSRPLGTGEFRAEHVPAPIGLLRRLVAGGYDVWLKDINSALRVLLTAGLAHWRAQPLVLWTGLWHHPQTPFHRLTFPLTRLIYRRADAIVGYGEHVRRYCLGLGLPREKLFLAPQAQDNEQYARPVGEDVRAERRRRLALRPGERVVLFVGRLEDGKGVRHLIEAFDRLDDLPAALVIAGDGPERSVLEAQTRERGLRAIFAGPVPTPDVAEYYALADLLVVPSVTTRRFREPWGLVVNEAMNQGVPVIATEAVGAAAGGLVRDGVTGLVVPERNPEALARVIRHLLTHEALRVRLGAAARAEVAGWTQEGMARGFLAAFEFAVEHRRIK